MKNNVDGSDDAGWVSLVDVHIAGIGTRNPSALSSFLLQTPRLEASKLMKS